jgi:hypothetical protein
MARTKQSWRKSTTAGKAPTSKAPASKAPRKQVSGKAAAIPKHKRKYRKRPGSKLISRKINTFANWIHSQGPSGDQEISEDYRVVNPEGTISTIGKGDYGSRGRI